MTIKLSMPKPETELKPRITVVGVGGAGGNAVNNMIQAELEGVDFVVANTDAQALSQSQAGSTIQLGSTITQGLGAGSRPEIGRAAAEEALDDILQNLAGSHMVFVTAGMGGGTGTGAAPVIARAVREHDILTVGVVTKPFHFEGNHRMKTADEGIEELQHFVDTLIIIPNQNLFRVANEKTTFAEAFKMADNVLYSGVRGVTDLMVMPGLINLDFADVRTVMSEMGKAMMGTGEASGEGRATQAAEAAINNPLLDDISMHGARAVLINVTGGMDMTLFEVDEAANRIRREIDSDAVIIFGSTFDEKLEGVMRVSIVATGIEAGVQRRETPTFVQAPITRRSTIISAPAAAGTAAATAAIAADDAAAAKPEAPSAEAAPAMAEDAVPQAPSRAEPEAAGDPAPESTAEAAGTGTPEEDLPYVPAFVPTKASRLAFLATGKPAPRDLALTGSLDETQADPAPSLSDDGDDAPDQMSIDEAIAAERARSFGSGMPADIPAVAEAEHAATEEPAGEPAVADPAPVMVADTAEELSGQRRPFVPAAPAEMPEEESVPAATAAGGKTSLINKISGLWTAKPQEETATARREPEVEAATAAPADTVAPAILDLPRADAMSRMPETPAAATLDGQADDLEIPAFLRRQAN